MSTDIATPPASLRTLEKGEDIPEGMCMISIPDHTGDTRKIWDPRNAEDVAMAKEEFEAAVRKGYRAFRVNSDTGEKDGQMNEFDATAGKVILVKQLSGG